MDSDIQLGLAETHFGIHGDLLLDIILGIPGFLRMDGELAMVGVTIPIGPDIIMVIIMDSMPEAADMWMVGLEDPIEPTSILPEEVVVLDPLILERKELPDREVLLVVQPTPGLLEARIEAVGPVRAVERR